MGCGNCGSGADGKPNGCKGNGGCSTSGCNRLNVYDWLAGLPLSDSSKPYPVIEVTFSNGSRKDFYRNNTNHIVEKGDWIAVEGVSGMDVGQVNLTGELVKLQLKKYGVAEHTVTKRVLHPATDDELTMSGKQKEREAEVLIRSRAIARNLNLEMKLCEVEIQADGKKGTFFYTADQRVDFRELIKLYAGDFKMKIEMRQIGARQESGKVGGIGSCGRELCCATWLTDFKSVNTTAARYQNLSINQTKLSGQCGRLKCCLNYELDTYMDALSVFPDGAEHLETVKGVAHLQKRDIFKNLMWYSYSDNNKQYPLSITRVKEIQRMNKQGQKADELQPVEIETKETKAGVKTDMGFVNDVGQITLKALEKNKKKKSKGKGGGQQGGQRPDQNRPQQASGAEGAQEKQEGRPQGERPKQQQQGGNRQGKPQQQGGGQQNKGGQQQGGGNKPQQNRAPQQAAEGGAQPQQPKQQQQKQQRPPRPQQQQAEGGAPNEQQPKPQGQPQNKQRQQGEGGTQQPKQGQQQNRQRQQEEGGAQQQPKEGQQQNRPQQQRNQNQPRRDNRGGGKPQQPRSDAKPADQAPPTA